jgi:hypothetical protein
MLDRAFDAWLRWPLWARIAPIAILISMADAAIMAWPERNFLKGFAESLVAVVLYHGRVVAAIAGGAWLGWRAAKRSSRNWLGWVAGIAAALAIVTIFDEIGERIPGVDWRMKVMRVDCDVDYCD